MREVANVYAFDPSARVWTLKAAIPVPAFGAATAVVGSRIYVIAGNVAGVCPDRITSNVGVYDTVSDTWSSVAPLPTAAVELAAGVTGGKIEAFGGFLHLGGGNGGVSALAEYDPASDTWTTRAGVFSFGKAATASLDGVICAIGGMTSIGIVENETWVYDRGRDAWAYKEPLPQDAQVLGPAAAAYNSQIFAFGSFGTWVYAPGNDIND